MSPVERILGSIPKRRAHPHGWPTVGESPDELATETSQPKYWRAVACAVWLVALGVFAGLACERFSAVGEDIRVAARR
jgi:hypothetical protein